MKPRKKLILMNLMTDHLNNRSMNLQLRQVQLYNNRLTVHIKLLSIAFTESVVYASTTFLIFKGWMMC